MNIEYHKWWSQHLNQDMELKVYGHYGKPVLVFPTQSGRFYQFEDFGMVAAVQSFLDTGKIKLFTIDSIDDQSWCNWSNPPAERAHRHEQYDHYIVDEVVPFMRQHCAGTSQKFLTVGCSLGGYHAPNTFFRHPEIFDGVISLSGMFDLRYYIGDYVDDTVYFNSPLYYLPNLTDDYYLDQYRQSRIIVCCGQGSWEGISLEHSRALQTILETKNVPVWIDLWGEDVYHDWCWWRKQFPYFLERLELQHSQPT